jgi:hypothetical protein
VERVNGNSLIKLGIPRDTLVNQEEPRYTKVPIDEEDEDNSYPPITLTEVHERVSKTPLDHLLDMIKEDDDACTADVILQTVFFNDVVYG